jgi:small subunit ribosomal protein S1
MIGGDDDPSSTATDAATATETATATATATDAATATAAATETETETATATETETTPGDAPAADGATATEGGNAAQAPRKKRRRRRRRRKDGPEATPEPAMEPAAEAAAADGAEAPPAEATPKKKERRKDRERSEARAERPPRPERPAFDVGDEIFGRVLELTDTAILLDVAGGKATGIYPRAELIQVPPRPGEQFIAKVKSYSARGGMLMLGRELWDTTQTKLELRAALETQNPIEVWVTGVIKGGLEVDYNGIRAFAPASHVELHSHDLTPLLGQRISVVVNHYGKKGRDVVVSRKAMLEEAERKKRDEELAKLAPEMVCRGVVRNVLGWGAFVALPDHGDIEGVVHMSEASHDRGARLGSVLSAGQQIEVKILRIDDKGKLWLSHKATLEDPWGLAAQKYTVGSVHRAKAVRLTDFGAFLQLEPGIDGLCHVADLSYTPIEHPKEVVSEGAEMDVIVVHFDAGGRKIALHPAPPEDERDEPRIGRLQPNQIVRAVVTQIREHGLGVRIVGATGRHARAFVHSGQSGTPRGTDLRKTFPIGKRIEAKVIEVDPRRGEARLSIRAVHEDAEKQAYREYRKKVQREATFGTFADLLKQKLERG